MRFRAKVQAENKELDEYLVVSGRFCCLREYKDFLIWERNTGGGEGREGKGGKKLDMNKGERSWCLPKKRTPHPRRSEPRGNSASLL